MTDIIERLREACHEIIEREREDLADMADPNCYGAGYCAGSIAVAREVLALLDEDDAP
jgi:hypothetical protein